MLLGCRFAHPHYRARLPFDRTIRKITAWPNHANRFLSFNSITRHSRRIHGTTGARPCHHLRSLAASQLFFEEFFIFQPLGNFASSDSFVVCRRP